jgi:PleD family two-component response regulator
MEALRRLATRDQLTGLLNRREFDRILAEERERSVRFGQPLSLVLIDIDHFKSVNDTHGHPVGDAVLAQVAKRLSAALREVEGGPSLKITVSAGAAEIPADANTCADVIAAADKALYAAKARGRNRAVGFNEV